jgi:Bacterial regulatory helix-turn-helix protein, lysR family
MELRHLRYFVAVAEAGSLTVAAEQTLRTLQPSLSRQIRDLEDEVGARLLTRRARGIELTRAGRAFLEHARVVLSQVEAAIEAARWVAHPAKPCFAMGFLTGHELTWMPEALQILRDELPNIDVMISSQYSPLLADGLLNGKSMRPWRYSSESTWDRGRQLRAPLLTARGSECRFRRRGCGGLGISRQFQAASSVALGLAAPRIRGRSRCGQAFLLWFRNRRSRLRESYCGAA